MVSNPKELAIKKLAKLLKLSNDEVIEAINTGVVVPHKQTSADKYEFTVHSQGLPAQAQVPFANPFGSGIHTIAVPVPYEFQKIDYYTPKYATFAKGGLVPPFDELKTKLMDKAQNDPLPMSPPSADSAKAIQTLADHLGIPSGQVLEWWYKGWLKIKVVAPLDCNYQFQLKNWAALHWLKVTTGTVGDAKIATANEVVSIPIPGSSPGPTTMHGHACIKHGGTAPPEECKWCPKPTVEYDTIAMSNVSTTLPSAYVVECHHPDCTGETPNLHMPQYERREYPTDGAGKLKAVDMMLHHVKVTGHHQKYVKMYKRTNVPTVKEGITLNEEQELFLKKLFSQEIVDELKHWTEALGVYPQKFVVGGGLADTCEHGLLKSSPCTKCKVAKMAESINEVSKGMQDMGLAAGGVLKPKPNYPGVKYTDEPVCPHGNVPYVCSTCQAEAKQAKKEFIAALSGKLGFPETKGHKCCGHCGPGKHVAHSSVPCSKPLSDTDAQLIMEAKKKTKYQDAAKLKYETLCHNCNATYGKHQLGTLKCPALPGMGLPHWTDGTFKPDPWVDPALWVDMDSWFPKKSVEVGPLLQAALEKEQLTKGYCVCDTNPETTNGPSQDCPVHGQCQCVPNAQHAPNDCPDPLNTADLTCPHGYLITAGSLEQSCPTCNLKWCQHDYAVGKCPTCCKQCLGEGCDACCSHHNGPNCPECPQLVDPFGIVYDLCPHGYEYDVNADGSKGEAMCGTCTAEALDEPGNTCPHGMADAGQCMKCLDEEQNG